MRNLCCNGVRHNFVNTSLVVPCSLPDGYSTVEMLTPCYKTIPGQFLFLSRFYICWLDTAAQHCFVALEFSTVSFATRGKGDGTECNFNGLSQRVTQMHTVSVTKHMLRDKIFALTYKITL